MRAIILAAGRGLRLAQGTPRTEPKCLLRFAGVTLLERHLRLLGGHGVDEVVLALGHAHRRIEDEVAGWALDRPPTVVLNDRFDLGSILTVHTVAASLTAGGDVLLMDADVLYDDRVLEPLLAATGRNAVLVDRAFTPGDEPVKVLVRDGVPLELSKRPAEGIPHDAVGESVGFFRFTEDAARGLAGIVATAVDAGHADLPHEDAVRDLIQGGHHPFVAVDVTGAPWTEIDFPADIDRAEQTVLPRLRPFAAAS